MHLTDMINDDNFLDNYSMNLVVNNTYELVCKMKEKWCRNSRKANIKLEFCMGYSDETWYVCSSGLMYYPCVLLTVDAHIKYLICIFLIG